MKNRKFSSLILVAILFSVGCTKDFGEINTDPTKLTANNFDPNTLLTNIELLNAGGDPVRTNLSLPASYVQLFADPRPGVWEGGDKYFETPDYSEAFFSNTYPNQIKLSIELLELTRGKSEYANLYQMGRILKAMAFQKLTDLYGDVPYFQAGQAFHLREFYPVYDKQELIYDDILKELEEASAALNEMEAKPEGDLIYNGDIAKWKRFGNSLLLRAGMRLVKVDEEKAKAIVTKVLGKTMSSNQDNAFVKGGGAGIDRTLNNQNSYVLRGDHGAQEHFYFKWAETFIDFLKNNNDPRLSRVARINVWGENSADINLSGNANGDPQVQKGLPNGKTTNPNVEQSIFKDPSWMGPITEAGLNQYSSVNPEMFDRNDPTFFLTYGESELLLAEAAARWGSAFGNPEEHYNNGVQAAMTYLEQFGESMTIPISEADAYLAVNPYDAQRGLEMINTQYWALTGTALNFGEAWINYRRTGFPALIPINYPGNYTGGIIPRRWPYPLIEATNNAVNLEAARAAIPGGDLLTSRVWWDKE